MSVTSQTRHELTALDWIGASVSLLMTLGLLYFPLAGRAFASMFKDFGSASLPPLTRLATSWWFPMGLALVGAGGVARGLRRRSTLTERRAWIVGSFLFATLALVLCVVGAYLPIFELAGNIRTG